MGSGASSWRTKSSKVVYENPWIRVREDQVVFPNGKDGIYGVVESKSPAVFIVPLDEAGNIYLIKQEHYTTQKVTWQCVAGRTDGEPAEVAAKRELLEEAGLRADFITTLLEGETASGMTNFKTTVCLARGLHADTSLIDKDEDILEIKKVPVATIKTMILNGEISATESIAALLLAIAYLEKEKTL